MKVKVSQLKPNPYRRMNHYPIDREKVEALKNSISETEFWDNILARQTSDGFEIAYGHHRLFALQELGIKEVEIPVKNLSDSRMLQIMANENHDDWHSSPAVINETVAAAKEYLDGELARCESWELLNKNIKQLFESKERFSQIKNSDNGVGQTTILKFLGKNWKQWQIQEALEIIREDSKVSRTAYEKFPTQTQAQAFKSAVKTFNVPKTVQKKIAKTIIKEGIGKRDIPARVATLSKPIREIEHGKLPPLKPPPDLNDALFGTIGFMQSLINNIQAIQKKAGVENVLQYANDEIKSKYIKTGKEVQNKIASSIGIDQKLIKN